MSNTLLMELNEEIRRLYIAGSDLAAGDYRLKRLLPSFQQLGERAPVFKKLGEGIHALIETGNCSGADSALQLQDVNLLLQSVLRTQGKGAAEGETLPIRTEPLLLQTRLSYRKLSAVRAALTTRGGGRYEVIQDAYREGLFQDLRLVPLAIGALNDPYAEIAELAMNEILPSYGGTIVPHLLNSFQPEGGKLESRKLTVIAKSGGDDVLNVIYKAAVSGSDEVRTTAIRLLGGHLEYEQALLDWSRDKKKGIREAAYEALADSGWNSAAGRLYEASLGKDSDLVNPSLARCHSVLLTEKLTEDFSSLLKSQQEALGDKQQRDELWTQVKRYLWSLHHKESPELEALYLDVLRHYDLYMFKLDWVFVANEAMNYMKKVDSEEIRRLIEACAELDLIHYAKSSSYTRETFIKVRPILSAKRLYEEYVKVLVEGANASALSNSSKNGKRLLETIEDQVVSRNYRAYTQVWAYGEKTGYNYHVKMLPQEEIAASWDSRWLDHFIEWDHLALVSAFARPDHPQAASYLLGKLQTSPEFRNRFANLTVMGLVRAGVKEDVLQEAIVRAMEDERNTECTEIEPYLFEQLCRLPASYAERISAVLPKFKANAEEQIEYILKNMR